MNQYYLMHKNNVCGILIMDDSGRILSYKNEDAARAPFLGNADLAKIKKWWQMRAIPASRSLIQELIKQPDGTTNQMYLAKNLAISMADSYWVCPADINIDYEDIQFWSFKDLNVGKIPYHNATSYDINASLGGQMEKYWDLSGNRPVLVKMCSDYYGQQSLNEVFATKIHEAQGTDLPYVSYSAELTAEHGILSRCDAFTTEDIELVSAYEVVESCKQPNDVSTYDHYIDTCAKNGIDKQLIRDFMDYQTLTDFIISNTDEHLQNFGVLRDVSTMKLIGPAPIFDSGNSMFYSDNFSKPFTRAAVLERKITAFYDQEEKMLAKIQNRNIVNTDLLPSPKNVIDFYLDGGVDEKKAKIIASGYEVKVGLVKDFQKGKTISLYTEKQREKEEKAKAAKESIVQIPINRPNFWMICGLPGSGKENAAEIIIQRSETGGKTIVPAENFFSLNDFKRITGRFLKPIQVMNATRKSSEFTNTATIISAKAIIKEYNEKGLRFESRGEVDLLLKARVKAALESGTDVICIGSFLTKESRNDLLEIAENAGCKKNIVVMQTPKTNDNENLPQKDWLNMAARLKKNLPAKDDGWDEISGVGTDQKKDFDIDEDR